MPGDQKAALAVAQPDGRSPNAPKDALDETQVVETPKHPREPHPVIDLADSPPLPKTGNSSTESQTPRGSPGACQRHPSTTPPNIRKQLFGSHPGPKPKQAKLAQTPKPEGYWKLLG